MRINERLVRALGPELGFRANIYTILNAIEQHIVRDRKTPHFLTEHFDLDTLFAGQFIDFMCVLDRICPTAGVHVIKKIGEIRGAKVAQYEQIIQALCEVIIAKKFVETYPPDEGFLFEWEPTDQTKKNPEFMITGPKWRILVEVKSPSLSDYIAKNKRARAQIVGRGLFLKDVIDNLYGKGNVALPLDNKMKDFLISAEAKFSSFAPIDVPTFSLLFVCWSDRMFEAITPVTNPGAGLFTERSFYKKDEVAVQFPSVSGVIITSHQFILDRLLKNLPLPPGVDGFEYGDYWEHASSANPTLCDNPHAVKRVPQFLQDVLHTVPAGQALDPLAQEMDFVHWLN